MYIIYNTETGAIRVQQSGSFADMQLNLETGESYLESNLNTANKKVAGGTLVDIDLPDFNPIALARHLRSGALAESDWTQNSDSPLNSDSKTAWATFRQELRDFPSYIAIRYAAEEEDVANYYSVEQLLPTPPGE
tara:strand:+ start:428 stop:832 length:405 start_codon:yes stop_codon:yes gene_type:complete